MEAGSRPAAADSDLAVLDRLIGRAPHAIAVTEGETHRIRDVNAAFCRLTGVGREEVLGRAYAEVFHQPGDEAMIAILDRVFRSGAAEEDSELTRRDGRSGGSVWSYTIWPTPPAAGSAPTLLVVEIRDHTKAAPSQRSLEGMAEQIRQINERLLGSALREQESAERAQAADRAKSDFLAMMSHELRTPLTGIVGYTDLMEAGIVGPVTQRQQNSLRRIKECSAQLLELIDDILTFAKAEAQGTELIPERVDLCALIREAAAVVGPVIARKGVELRVQTPGVPLPIETDPRKLRQVLLNLLSNAAKFTDQGEIRLEVREEGPEVVRLAVSDTGIGIQPRDLERVFEPFVQAEAVLTRRNGGTGLGLAISRALTATLGGKLEVESTPGEGSTFTFLLPRSIPPVSSSR